MCRKRLRMVLEVAKRHLALPQGGTRKAEILALASIGLSDREIADVLKISVDTIGTHWRRATKELGASNRTEALAILFEREFDWLSARDEAESQESWHTLSAA